MRTVHRDRGGALPGLLAFCLSMLVILAGVYAFFRDYRERYLDPVEALQAQDSTALARRDSVLADSLAREVASHVTRTLAAQEDSLRRQRDRQDTEPVADPGAARTAETPAALQLSPEDEALLLRVLRAMEPRRAARQIRRLGPEAAAGVLALMSGRQQTSILAALPSGEREAYRRELAKRRPGSRRS